MVWYTCTPPLCFCGLFLGELYLPLSNHYYAVEQCGYLRLPCPLLRTKKPTRPSVPLAHECPEMSLPLA